MAAKKTPRQGVSKSVLHVRQDAALQVLAVGGLPAGTGGV